MFRIFYSLVDHHDLRLVCLAACICALASFTTVTLITRSLTAKGGSSVPWTMAAATVFGCGVWSLHFVAMLAFMPDMPVFYDTRITVASIGIAVFGALVALIVWQWVGTRALGAVFGGILLGLSVAGMHYCGVAAMEVHGHKSLNPGTVGTSIFIAIAIAACALWRLRVATSLVRRIEVSATLAICVCCVHFVGMSAMEIDDMRAVTGGGSVFGSGSLACLIGFVSMAILTASLAATLVDQHLSQRSLLELNRIRLLSGLCREVIFICRNGRILEVNAAGSRLLDIETQGLIGLHLLDLIPTDKQPLVYRQLFNPSPETSEASIRTKSGLLVPVEMSSSAIDYEGKPAVAIAF